MSERQSFVLANMQVRQRAAAAVATAPDGYHVQIKPPTRSLDQNAAQWPYLDAFSKQLQWPVNGRMVTISPEDFKDVLSAAFHQESVRLAMGLDGGVVMLGRRTSQFTKAEFSEWIEFLQATAAARGVAVYEEERA